MTRRDRTIFCIFVALFLLSGFAALIYQVVWQRMLGCFVGVDIYSINLTVSAFMLGLGCGSLAGGHLIDRWSAARGILIFCAAEAVTAVFALLSKYFYYDLLYDKFASLGAFGGLLPAILFLSLLCPTFCMGLTLPVLAKSFTDKIESAPAIVGYLYGANTAGAALGAFTTVWILLRRFGFEEILRIGAMLNAIVAVAAGLIWLIVRARAAAQRTDNETSTPTALQPLRFSMAFWIAIYALAGFVALGLEIIWFRFFSVLQKASSFSFGNSLAIYLLGLAVGTFIGIPLALRVRRPARAFLFVQTAAGLYAVGAILFLVMMMDKPPLSSLWSYLQTYDPINFTNVLSLIGRPFAGAQLTPDQQANLHLLRLIYLFLPVALIFPTTALFGLGFPLLQRTVQVSFAHLGRRVAWLQSANIVGCVCGVAFVGSACLRWLGFSGTLRVLTILSGVFAFLLSAELSRGRRARVPIFATAAIVLMLMLFAVPSHKALWAKLHGSVPERIIAREDDSGISVLKNGLAEPNEETLIYSNGIGHSWIPYGTIHTQIGAMGALLHPQPVDIAVIGLGSGDTLFALGASPHTARLTCIEIVRPEYPALSALARNKNYPPLTSLLNDKRVQWRFTDGRAYLQRSKQLFDVIEADALHPASSYSGFLYSYEYFRMLRTRLKPGGMAVSWVPTERVFESFLSAFPYVLVTGDVAIGSSEPIVVDYKTLLSRLEHPFTKAYYGLINVDVRELIRPFLTEQYDSYSPETPRAPLGSLNSDLFPRDEFGVK